MEFQRQPTSLFVPLSRSMRWIILIGLGGLLTGIGLVNALHGHAFLVFPFLTLLLFAFVLAIPLFFYRPDWGLFHPLVFTVIWHGVFHDIFRRLPLLLNGLDHHIALPGEGPEQLSSLIVAGHLFTSLGFLAMYAGYWLGAGIRSSQWVFPPPTHLIPKVALVAAISTLALALLAGEAGGLDRLAIQRGMHPELRASAALGGYWIVIAGLLGPACLVWLSLRPLDFTRPVFVGIMILALAIGYITTGSRGGLIMTIVLALAIRMLQIKRIAYIRAALISMFALVALGLLGEFRSQSMGARELDDIQLESGLIQGAERGWDTLTEYAGKVSGMYAILALVPEQVDYLRGLSYLSIFTAPIPRTLWNDKPMAGGRLAGILLFGRETAGGGVPPGSIGEAYWNFGLAGVVGVMLLYGIFLRWMTEIFRVNHQHHWVFVIYLVTLLQFQPNTVAFYAWLHDIIPALAFLFFFCGFPRRAHPIPAGILPP